MTSFLMLIAEILVAILLVATVVTSVRLSRRITRMQADETAMRATVVELMKATETAERAIAGLRTTLGDCEKTLADRLRVAERYASDLAEQVEAGENVMNRMMSIVDSSRQAVGTPQPQLQPQPHSIAPEALVQRDAPQPAQQQLLPPAPQPVVQPAPQLAVPHAPQPAPQRLVSDRISEAAEMLAQRAMRRAAPQGNVA
ncbi:MAG TPA: DUF6468 domain-containing protein [Saliniramus sp.]|nr:DUF6468 domain-containing protein [Saliniramus sp.]